MASESIRDWLDNAVKAGYAAKFASAFDEVGIEDTSDLQDMDDELMEELERVLAAADAKTMHVKKIKAAIGAVARGEASTRSGGGLVMKDLATVSKLFAEFDHNDDGFITQDELLARFSKLAAPDALLRQLNVQSIEAAAGALMKLVDTNNDGRIRCPFAATPIHATHAGPLARRTHAHAYHGRSRSRAPSLLARPPAQP